MFPIHHQLAADTINLGRLGQSHVLLHPCASVLWFILVPETEKKDIFEMEPASRAQLRGAMDTLGVFVRNQPGIAKVNVAAIGNIVPQLHIHIIGRSEDDFCWPGVVWGSELPGTRYSEAEIEAYRQHIIIASTSLPFVK